MDPPGDERLFLRGQNKLYCGGIGDRSQWNRRRAQDFDLGSPFGVSFQPSPSNRGSLQRKKKHGDVGLAGTDGTLENFPPVWGPSFESTLPWNANAPCVKEAALRDPRPQNGNLSRYPSPPPGARITVPVPPNRYPLENPLRKN